MDSTNQVWKLSRLFHLGKLWHLSNDIIEKQVIDTKVLTLSFVRGKQQAHEKINAKANKDFTNKISIYTLTCTN